MINWIKTEHEPPPKDGTRVLLYQEGHYAVGGWTDTSTESQEEVSRKGKFVTYEWVKHESGYWDMDEPNIYEPTHWAKLEPPE